MKPFKVWGVDWGTLPPGATAPEDTDVDFCKLDGEFTEPAGKFEEGGVIVELGA